MLTDYIEAALRKAKYQLLSAQEGFYAVIPGLKGVCANASSLESCRDELRSVLEEWIIVKLRHNDDDLPIISGINLNGSRMKKKTRVA